MSVGLVEWIETLYELNQLTSEELDDLHVLYMREELELDDEPEE